jgi:hypothetical protein
MSATNTAAAGNVSEEAPRDAISDLQTALFHLTHAFCFAIRELGFESHASQETLNKWKRNFADYVADIRSRIDALPVFDYEALHREIGDLDAEKRRLNDQLVELRSSLDARLKEVRSTLSDISRQHMRDIQTCAPMSD